MLCEGHGGWKGRVLQIECPKEGVCEKLRGLYHDQSGTGLGDHGGREVWGMLRNVTGKVGRTLKGLMESLYFILRLVG